MFLEEREHLSKARATGALCGFVVAELDDDLQSFALCVTAQELALGGDAEPFFCLLFAVPSTRQSLFNKR